MLRIANGVPQPLATDVRLGTPAGLTLSACSTSLLISSLNQGAGTAQVLIVDLAKGTSTVLDQVIGSNPAAGGLHRAHQGDKGAWAGIRSGVYRLCVCDLADGS